MRFGAEGFTLANGLEVVVIPNHRAPIVTQMVWYKVGGADEPRGTSGIAHFLEHLMFKGTKTMQAGAFSRLVAQNGGRENAFTTEDYTAFYQTVAADRLEMVMKLEADRMNGLVLNDAVVLPERDVILEERRMRIDNDPASLLAEQINAALYLHHPYRIPTIGWESEMEKLSTADAVAFYERWYHPNNAILVVSGDADPGEVRRLAERYYGPIPAAALPPRERVAEPPHVAATRLESRSDRVAQPQWSRSYLAPSYTGGETRYAYPLQVLTEILGGGATSRLHRSLVTERKLALDVGAFYSPGGRDSGRFGFYATPRSGISVTEIESAIDAEVAAILAKGVDASEVERATRRMVAAEIYARDGVSGPARIFGAALATGRRIADVEAWPDRIAKVTAEEVDAAARFVLKPETSVTGILLPTGNVSAAAPRAPATPLTGGGSIE
jgi:zinc protease